VPTGLSPVSSTLLAASIAIALATASSVGGGGDVGRVPTCRSSQLAPRHGFYGEAGLQFVQTLILWNRAPHECALAGWPTIRPIGGSARRTMQRVVTVAPGEHPYTTVLLPPTAAASFDLYGADFDAGTDRACPRAGALRITPPGDSRPLLIRVALPDCGLYEVAPLVAGATDRAAWSYVWKR
jgi:Domain of unknown function (DUF4232)